MNNENLTVLYFGMYDPNYARNAVLINGLKANGVKVIECQDNSNGIAKFKQLYKKHKKYRGQYDIMVVGFLGHIIVPFAKIITRRPVIFDSFVSLYDSNIFDRKLASPRSIKALWYWIIDWISMHLADVILFDTKEHADYASRTFHIRREKIKSIFIGSQDNLFTPLEYKKPGKIFEVLFYGGFIPLQGIEYILNAAKLIKDKDIHFTIVGDGQEKKRMVAIAEELKLSNVTFHGYAKFDEIRNFMNQSDVCLGIFGNTPKTQRVIPNKVYECIAVRKPVITSDTPASRELFTPNDVILVPPADANAIADAIKMLKNNPKMCIEISKQGYKKFMETASQKVLGSQLKQIITQLV